MFVKGVESLHASGMRKLLLKDPGAPGTTTIMQPTIRKAPARKPTPRDVYL
jgi:hypothetical protein